MTTSPRPSQPANPLGEPRHAPGRQHTDVRIHGLGVPSGTDAEQVIEDEQTDRVVQLCMAFVTTGASLSFTSKPIRLSMEKARRSSSRAPWAARNQALDGRSARRVRSMTSLSHGAPTRGWASSAKIRNHPASLSLVESNRWRETPDLDLVGPFQCLGQLPCRLEPVPSVGSAAERLVEADRHLG